jgi:kynurenine formamidase
MAQTEPRSAGPDSSTPTVEDVKELGERLRRWGSWGPEDEKGALNFITPEKRLRAASLVKRGAVFSLALPIQSGNGPMRAGGTRFNPMHFMTDTGESRGHTELGGDADFTDDVLVMPLQSTTQWDALCHVYYEDALYNGYPASTVTAHGASRNGIGLVHSEFIGRSVLLDIARFEAVDCLPSGHAITIEELDNCAAAQGVEIEEGDLILVRTGQMSQVDEFRDWSVFQGPQAGLHFTVCEWLADHRIAAVAADNSMVEASGVVPGLRVPFHMIALRDMGVSLGEFWNLESLALDCAEDGVYEFMLIAQAMPIEGATGSPVNPIAMK